MRSCTFIGHKNCKNDTKERLALIIENLITKEKVNVFYVGTQGNFDKLVYEVLCELEKTYSIHTYIVLAYLKHSSYEYYDRNKTIFPDVLTKTPLRFAIRKRNSYMINKSDFLVCYLNNALSNTYTNVVEAIKKRKQIINLGEMKIDSIKE